MCSAQHGVVVAVDNEQCEMTVEQVERPWRRRDQERYEKSPEAERRRQVYGWEPEANDKTGRRWFYAPVRAAKEDGKDEEDVKQVRKKFHGMVWGVGHEVELTRRGGEGSFTAERVGKWAGRSTCYDNGEYFY